MKRPINSLALTAALAVFFCFVLCGCGSLSSLSNHPTNRPPKPNTTPSTTAPYDITDDTTDTTLPQVETAAPTTTTTKATLPEVKAPSHYFATGIDYTVVSSDGYVNVRRGPSADYEVFSTVAIGTIITALAQEGDWVFYQAPAGPNGWIHLSGLLPVVEMYWQAIMPSESQKLPDVIYKTVVADDGANLRIGPSSTDYGVLSNVPKGCEVTVSAQSGDWYFCYFAQTSGWTHKSNLS